MGNDVVNKFKKLHSATRDFLEEKDVENQEDERTSRWWRFAHFWLLSGKFFWRNRCPVRASALAYTTLLALIPLLAIAVSVSSALLQKQGEEPIRNFIDGMIAKAAPALDLDVKTGGDGAAVETQGKDNTASEAAKESKKKREELVARIYEFISNIRSGTLGATSVLALVFVAIGLLRTVEAAFNDIWGVTSGRGWVRSLVMYWAAITLGPLMMVVAVGVTTGSQVAKTATLLVKLGVVGTLMLKALPFVVLSFAFALLYQLMPNTRVRWRAALVGGVVGGCLWQLNSLFNVIYVSKAVTYANIYGSLSIIPLFLIGLYFSWLIVLFGAQVAYVYQNRIAYLQSRLSEHISQRGKEFIALRIMTVIAGNYVRTQKPPNIQNLSVMLGVPSRLVSQLLDVLSSSNLVVSVMDSGFVPARPVTDITVKQVVESLRSGRGGMPATSRDPHYEAVRSEYDRVQDLEGKAAENVTMMDLISAGAKT